jgi:DNA-binding transcriptional regulator YhcF (GntR family)
MTTTRSRQSTATTAAPRRKTIRKIQPGLKKQSATRAPLSVSAKPEKKYGATISRPSASIQREPNVERDSLWLKELVRLYVPDPDKFATDVVFETTCELIRTGTLQQGDRVPSYTDLSVQLSVDTYSINLAYGRLQKEGILKAVSRSGSFVASAAAVDHLSARSAFSQAIQDCRKRGMTRADVSAIFQTQIKRHFDEGGRPDEPRPRSRKKSQ